MSDFRSAPTSPGTLQAAIVEIDRLRTLVEASKLINSSIESDKLFDSILEVARRELDVERGTLYFLDRERGEIWSKIASGLAATEIRLPVGKGLAGVVAETGEAIILHDAYSDPRFDPSSDLRSGFKTRSMLCVPIQNRQGTVVGVLQLLNKRSGDFGRRDLDFLEALSDHMAIAMENAMLHLSAMEKDRMERELRLGREIQGKLLPPPPDDIPGLEISASCIPCYEVGGDYFDFIKLDSGELAFALGDVSGKGVSAAMIMSGVQAAFRLGAPVVRDLPNLVERLNTLLYRTAGGRKYVTFFCGFYDPQTGHLRYANAGHNPPLVVHGATTTRLEATGTPIGLLPRGTFGEAATVLEPGSTLVLYTDGFVEAEDPAEEQYGMDRWTAAVAAVGEIPVAAVPAQLNEMITEYENGAKPIDDKTIVVMRRHG
ncbi:MAG: GAF domain-containing SpoIIE family protein phosphatase [Thermoanaerobaculia bacterium]|jgi:sigma-B regulation protein RsbU (phosphoserine phosphatase)